MLSGKGYDNLNRLLGITNTPSSGSALSFNYSYNSANQRTAVTNADSSVWNFGYDALGQVTNGLKNWSDGSLVAGQQFQYVFDDIGNRQSTASGGDPWGANLRYANYSANNLNQYTSRTVPGYADDLGSANSNATVTLWGSNGFYKKASRKGAYFRGELPANNSTGALWLTVTNVAVLNQGTNADVITNSVGSSFVPKTPESFGYDPDGNLTNDGRWAYTWDAENRLVSMTANTTCGPQQMLTFAYDWRGRRIQKVVFDRVGSSYVANSTNTFVYDGWNLLAELGPSNSPTRICMWGIDLSGTMEGTGGVGGLLAINDVSYAVQFVACDGNGNVAGLAKAADGTVSALYEYGPFGELVRVTGPMARINPLRFSTKYQDDETDFLYYGYRYYSTSTGRWLGKEPLQEAGSANLMGFIDNDCINSFDVLGLFNSAGHFYTTYLVARAAGLSDNDAFIFAYWSQYPDQDQSYDATHNFPNLQWEIGRYFHSLSGGDPNKLRSYLACLLKSGQFSNDEMGILIHALGDAYAHTYVDMNPTFGSPKQLRPNPNYGHETLYGPGIGHGLAGHIPDYIGHDPAKYGNYVDQLYGILNALPNAGIPHPEWVADLKAGATTLPTPGFSDYFSSSNLNQQEVDFLSSLPGGYGGSLFNTEFQPDQQQFYPNMTRSVGFRSSLIDKIKNGVKGCCPPK